MSTTTARERLAALHRDFNAPGSTIHLHTFSAQHEALLREIHAEAAAQPASAPAPAAPAPAVSAKPFSAGKALLDLVETMGEAIGARLRGHDDRLAALERRLAQVEATKGIAYRGIWTEGTLYSRGDFATSGGSCWHANCETYSKPGESPDWTLAVKCGRDGKDLR